MDRFIIRVDIGEANSIERTLKDEVVVNEGSLIVKIVEENLNFIQCKGITRTGIELSVTARGSRIIEVLNIDTVA